MPEIVPTGWWKRSPRHRVAWALSQVLARREDASRRRAIARWQTRLRRELDRALARIDWKAWARRRAVTKAIGWEPDVDLDDLPELDLRGVNRVLRDLYRDAARNAWKIQPGDVALPFPEAVFDEAMGDTFDLVSGVNESMKERMQSIMRETMDAAENFEQFGRNLRSEFSDLSVSRARMIAVTEYNRAASTSTQLLYEAQGVELKQWNTVGDDRVCEVCLENQAEGAIPIKASFASGDQNPPTHPNCRCNISAAGD